MRKSEMKVGKSYTVKINGKVVPVTLESLGPGGMDYRQITTYIVRDLSTGHKMTLRVARRFIAEISPAEVENILRGQGISP